MIAYHAYMKDTNIESDAAPVFRLAELARLYETRLKLLGWDVSGRQQDIFKLTEKVEMFSHSSKTWEPPTSI